MCSDVQYMLNQIFVNLSNGRSFSADVSYAPFSASQSNFLPETCPLGDLASWRAKNACTITLQKWLNHQVLSTLTILETGSSPVSYPTYLIGTHLDHKLVHQHLHSWVRKSMSSFSSWMGDWLPTYVLVKTTATTKRAQERSYLAGCHVEFLWSSFLALNCPCLIFKNTASNENEKESEIGPFKSVLGCAPRFRQTQTNIQNYTIPDIMVAFELASPWN